MREFIEVVYEYPWVTFFLFIGIICIIAVVGDAIAEARGHGCKCGKEEE